MPGNELHLHMFCVRRSIGRIEYAEQIIFIAFFFEYLITISQPRNNLIFKTYCKLNIQLVLFILKSTQKAQF